MRIIATKLDDGYDVINFDVFKDQSKNAIIY